jgi:hypothetical protein
VTVSGPGTEGQEQWKPEELELRKEEIKQTHRAVWAQVAVAACAVVATLAAAYAAKQAADAVQIAAKGIEQQAHADRLSTAISAIGGDRAAERAAGFALLRRHVEDRVNTADSPEERLDAYNLYTSALDVLENYLRKEESTQTTQENSTQTTLVKSTQTTQEPVGLGFGRPHFPYDNKYAANELKNLLKLQREIKELRSSIEDETKVKTLAPSVDLSEVQLTQQSWEGVNFAWLGGKFFRGIDLRGANLKESIWEKSFLQDAHLQCANLEGADLRGANLIGADLRGAYLKDTDFTGAKLRAAKFKGATLWKTKGLPKHIRPKPGVSRGPDIDKCLDYEPYWDMPAAAPSGSPEASPRPSTRRR